MNSASGRRSLFAALWLTTALSALPARADPAPPFPVLLREAESSAPRLMESAADLRRAQGLADQAGARLNPTVGLQVENFAGDGMAKGLSIAETTLQLSQPIELGGKRPARVASGRAEVDAARARQTQKTADFAFDLAAAYAGAEAADRRLTLSADALALTEEDARAARAMVQAGKEADVRALQADAAVSAARAERDQLKAEREAAFARLTALSGAPVPLTSITTSLLDRPLVGPAQAGDPLRTPTYLAAQAEREAASRHVRLEQLRSTPDLTVSLGVRRIGEDRSTALVAGVSAPMPLFDRNRGNQAAARAELDAAEARLNAARLDATAELRAGAARLDAAGARLLAAHQTEQAADEVYRLTRIGYEGGKLALFELTAARRALAEARSATLAAQLDRLTAEATLARLAGQTPFGDAS